MPLIVIEGLDGSGKATNAALLEKRLKGMGLPTLKISFPDYESDSSALVRMYLSGAFGDKPQDVNAYAASAFYAVDRYASFKTGWGSALFSGAWVIADRYTTSNAVHQASKLKGAARDEYLEWLYEFEFDRMGLPRPDAVVYLDVPPDVSQKLMTGRYGGKNSKKDIHERNVAYLKKSREAALYAAAKLGWTVVTPVKDGALPPPEQVESEIFEKLKLIFPKLREL